MVQSILLTTLTNEPNIIHDIGKPNETGNKHYKNERKLINSKSFNCLADSQIFNKMKNVNSNDNNNNAVNNNLVSGLIKKSKSLNELYYIQKTSELNKKNIEIHTKKSISTSKIEKCVRFNDDIKVHELNDEDDRRPMPLAKMYYKDQVELYQLREEMKRIQYRIINKIEGSLLLGN